MNSTAETSFIPLTTLIRSLKVGHKLQTPFPGKTADAFFMRELLQQNTGCHVILCLQSEEAQRLQEDLQIFAPQLRVRYFPDWETLVYDAFSPHKDLTSERLKTLYALLHQQVDVLIVSIGTALQRLVPVEFIAQRSFLFRQGDTVDRERLRQQLVQANYESVSQVSAPGEFSVRGSIVDIFPMGSAVPYRLDFLDEEVDSIRTFDVDTQRTIYPVAEIALLPGSEYPFDEAARNNFRQKFREIFEGDPTRSLLYKEVGQGIAFQGIEYYFPLFFEKTACLFDYLPNDTTLIFHQPLTDTIQSLWQEIHKRYQFFQSDTERKCLPPSELFLSEEQFFQRSKDFKVLVFSALDTLEQHFAPAPTAYFSHHASEPAQALKDLLAARAEPFVLCAQSKGREETLSQLLEEQNIPVTALENLTAIFQSPVVGLSMTTAAIHHGFTLRTDTQTYTFLTEAELFQNYTVQRNRRKKATDPDAMIRDLVELHIDDLVVHQQHGIGRYLGMEHMEFQGHLGEFLHLEYAQETRLYIPIDQLHLISRYVGADSENTALQNLGSKTWEKNRQKAIQQAFDTAAELLEIYAKRAARMGYSFQNPLAEYEAFCSEFPFEETPDQAAAIEAVIKDLLSPQPMDRLVCGDVGFGKTEVALRAAFIAAMNHKQVAILCPTTLLAEQHAQNFRDRFAQWPIKVAELSRFQTNKETKATIELISKGLVDIVIGTHKLLSDQVHFPHLGLVIIDEEHRFGVRQKEALKALRAEVDVLTLTATPIPRTLAMSLEGIREFSVIATAPQKRLAIKTFVRREEAGTIREAILRELKRGGQVYFLHNEVDTIHNRALNLSELIPEARIAIAHGQMPERELESVMKDFYQKRANVLLCTTIIETGIDVPNANTIIIHRADKFGLAQLHQLRGRVGRSHHQAYAYLLIPGEDAITKNAQKRLEAIQSLQELGSGFYLAMHDLEIRGTGEVLGDAQSGTIQNVGFHMYNEMLQQAIQALKKGESIDLNAPLATHIEVFLDEPALLPEDYCGDALVRLQIYKRLADSMHIADIAEIQEEIIDRFGTLPAPVTALLESHRLRIQAKALGIIKLRASSDSIQVTFDTKTPLDPFLVIQLIQRWGNMKPVGKDKIIWTQASEHLKERIKTIERLLNALKDCLQK